MQQIASRTLRARSNAAQKIGMSIATAGPFVGLILAIALLWNRAVAWHDIVVLVVIYCMAGLGITLGYHRMLTHKAFRAVAPLRAFLLACGALAVQGPPLDWAANHRMHHANSDDEGDPHSPHHGFPRTIAGRVRGFLHAHVVWMFKSLQPADRQRWVRDLCEDRVVAFMNRTHGVWMSMSLLLPFVAGYLLSGFTWSGAFSGLLWGGAVRLFFNYHITWSINSVCHVFGKRPFESRDLATNNWLLAIPSFGESWHHNHHVFPSSAVHGIGRWQVDVSAWLVSSWEKVGLISDVHRPTTEQLQRKLQAPRDLVLRRRDRVRATD